MKQALFIWLALLLIAGGLPALSLHAQEPDLELDLEEAVTLALAHNPALRAEEERLIELDARVREVWADAKPQVSAYGGWERSRNPSFLNSADFEDFVEAFPGGSFEPAATAVYSLGTEVSQPLFTFGKIRAAVALTKTLREATVAQIETTRLDTALEAAEAFFELLRAEQALEALEIQERGRREALDVVEARYEIGEATELERLRAVAALAQVRPRAARLQGDLDVAVSELRLALGVGENLDADGAIRPVSRASSLPQAPSPDALLAAARRHRPELKDLAFQRQALEHRQRVIRADGKPRLDFNGRYGHTSRRVEDLSDTLFQDWSLSFDLRWDFFDGGRRKGQLSQLESQGRQLALLLDDQERRIRVELETAEAAYRSARETWLASQESVAAAREASRVAGETYREGVALQADLLDAQERTTEAELDLIGAFFDARIEAARLHRAAGLLPTQRLTTTGGETRQETRQDIPLAPTETSEGTSP